MRFACTQASILCGTHSTNTLPSPIENNTSLKIFHLPFKCRDFRGQGQQPYMSILPSCRFPHADINHYPVRTLGIDFIGSFEVVEKRLSKTVCLPLHLSCEQSSPFRSCKFPESRLVHVHQLCTRFVARRRVPEIIYSDDATNFLATKKEIRRQPLALNEKIVGIELAR